MGVICNDEEKEKRETEDNNTEDSSIHSERNRFIKKRIDEDIKYEPKNKVIISRSKVTIDTNLITSGGTNNPYYEYYKIKLLGEGSFGKVFLAKNKKLNMNFAMKIIKKAFSDIQEDEKIMNEINILK